MGAAVIEAPSMTLAFAAGLRVVPVAVLFAGLNVGAMMGWMSRSSQRRAADSADSTGDLIARRDRLDAEIARAERDRATPQQR